MDLKTASILQVPRRVCVQANVLTVAPKDSTETVWKEQVTSGSTDRDKLIEKIKAHPTLGIVKVVGKQVTDYEDGLDMQEAARVQN